MEVSNFLVRDKACAHQQTLLKMSESVLDLYLDDIFTKEEKEFLTDMLERKEIELAREIIKFEKSILHGNN